MTLSHPFATLLACALVLSGCMPGQRSAMQSLPLGADPATTQLAEMKDAFDALSPPAKMAAPGATPVMPFAREQAPMLTGLGFAQIAGQPGKTPNEKRLMAIRAARMEALRDLTEQVHGIHIDAETTLRDAIVQNDRLTGVVEGSIRGARTLRITPRDADSYEVLMALDRDTVAYILRAAKGLSTGGM